MPLACHEEQKYYLKSVASTLSFSKRRQPVLAAGMAGRRLRGESKCAMETRFARVAELVDALDLESSTYGMGVQLPPLAPSRPPRKGVPRGI